MFNKGGGIFIFLILILLSGFFCTEKVIANTPNIIINEVCWMGGLDSSGDEWIELKNNTNSDIDLAGFIIKSKDESPIITLKGIIPSGGYFLLERSDDESVVGITADLIYSGALGNSGEELEIYDGDDNLIDSILIEDGWPAGDNETKQTMEKIGDLWQTSNNVLGTPKAKNSSVDKVVNNESEDESAEPPVQIEKKTKKKVNLIINEIFVNPRGLDREVEFIELFNQGDTAINLKQWRLENDKGQVYEFGKFDDLFGVAINNTIPSKGFLAIFRSISNIALDNNGGEIKLFAPDKKTAKQVLKYKKAKEGFSYIDSKTINFEKITTSTKKFLLNSTKLGEWVWTAMPTPGKTNQVEGVNTAPRVSFSVPEEILPNQSIFFDASDTIDEDGDILEFSWDFGDGIKLSLEDPSHMFLNPGVYDVKLQVSDGKEMSVLNKKIEVFGSLDDFGGVAEIIKDKNNIIGETDYDFSWIEEFEAKNNYKVPDFSKKDEFMKVSLREARDSSLNTKVIIEGVVVVLPGVFGNQYFYIINKEALKIYNYKKDFPDISLGDLVKVKGEISQSGDEKYLKTKNGDDVEIIKNLVPILAKKINKMEEEYLYRLVEVEGVVLANKNSRVYLETGSGDEMEEVVVYIKSLTGIDKKRTVKGEKVKITGLVFTVSGELVIMPRSDDDIISIKKEEVGEVAGAYDEAEEWSLAPRDEKNDLLKYLGVILFFGGVVLVAWYLKKKKEQASGVV